MNRAAALHNLTVVKLGGSLIDADGGGVVLTAVARARARGERLLLVHGGGGAFSRWLARFGVPSRFLAGQRVTTPDMLPPALMVLGGLLNRGIVEGLARRDCPAIGLTGADGGAVVARRARRGRLGAVGEVTAVNARLFHALIEAGQVPVVASLAWSRRHGWLNVNADLMAAALAAGLRAGCCC
jgi:acetylglutamate kinase